MPEARDCHEVSTGPLPGGPGNRPNRDPGQDTPRISLAALPRCSRRAAPQPRRWPSRPAERRPGGVALTAAGRRRQSRGKGREPRGQEESARQRAGTRWRRSRAPGVAGSPEGAQEHSPIWIMARSSVGRADDELLDTPVLAVRHVGEDLEETGEPQMVAVLGKAELQWRPCERGGG